MANNFKELLEMKSTKFKALAVVLLALVLAYLNFKYTFHLNYAIRFSIRIPQVFMLVWLLVNWVGKEKKLGKSKWRIKNPIVHYILVALGMIELVSILYFGHTIHMVDHVSDVQSITETAQVVKSEITWELVVMELIGIPLILALPLYSFMHIIHLFLRFTVWSYGRGLKYFIIALFAEDLFYTGLLTILR
jgi:hypothetical protein